MECCRHCGCCSGSGIRGLRFGFRSGFGRAWALGWRKSVFRGGGLDGAEDLAELAFEIGVREGEDDAAGVEHDIDGGAELGEVEADGLAHAALDAVAFDGAAEDLAGGEADVGAIAGGSLQCGEVAEVAGVLLAGGGVDALIVSMLAQAEGGRAGTDWGVRRHRTNQRNHDSRTSGNALKKTDRNRVEKANRGREKLTDMTNSPRLWKARRGRMGVPAKYG